MSSCGTESGHESSRAWDQGKKEVNLSYNQVVIGEHGMQNHTFIGWLGQVGHEWWIKTNSSHKEESWSFALHVRLCIHVEEMSGGSIDNK